MHHLDVTIAERAALQHGLISQAQLRELGVAAGLSHRRCSAGHWRRIGNGVFVVGGAPRTFRQRVMAGLLSAGGGAMVSHRTAVDLWAVRTIGPVPIEITIPRGRSINRRGVLIHTSGDLDRAAPTMIDGITVTGLARSLLDLGAVAPGRVRRAVWDARRTHDLSWDELLGTLIDHARRGRSGVGPLRRVVAAHYDDLATDSSTEDLAYGLLFDSGRVPVPDKQVRVRCADGAWVTADLGWPKYRALIEIHGIDHFTNEDLQQIDLHRQNQLELAGFGVLTYSGRLLRQQPDQFVADARVLLERQGWSPSGLKAR